jgi:hypothetical protein
LPDDGGFAGDDGEFGRRFNDAESGCMPSPPNSHMKDIIDWSVSGEEVAELKAKLLMYICTGKNGRNGTKGTS